MKTVRLGIVQHRCTTDCEANIARSLQGIYEAAAQGAQLIVLPELHTSHYFCQTEETSCFDLAEPIPGPSTTRFGTMAKELGVVIVTSLFERRAPGLYHNTAVVLETDGSVAGRYRKMHIPDDPGYYEKFYFTPGDLGFTPITTSLGCLGVLICWDQWFPEAARLMAMAGAELLIYPTAIGYDPNDSATEQNRQRNAWVTVQRSHAVANSIPVVSVNRVGFEADPSGAGAGAQFWGNSFVAGCQGELLAVAATDQEQVLTADLDLQRSEQVRRIWPYFRDRRTDAYGDLVRRYRD
ncbi:MAG: carbon-nitrogen hydrolase [Desulfobulbus oligotrophicus]|jgi:N-carbamoylputrescine amidase|nr:carbon-nitrogen hydrolase [Desulfobulbus oligotrophicus]